MKCYFVIALGAMWLPVLGSHIELTPNGRKAAQLSVRGSKASLEDVRPEDKAEVLSILRQIAEGKVTEIGTKAPSKSGADVALLTLGDRPTIERLINEYRVYNSQRTLAEIPQNFEWSKQALLIPYLAEDLFLDDDPKATVVLRDKYEAIIGPNLSIRSGISLVRIMQTSEVFSERQKKWALEMERLRVHDVVKFRDRMRLWWNRNKAHFEKHDYAAVDQSVEGIDTIKSVEHPPAPSSSAEPLVAEVPKPLLPPVVAAPSVEPTAALPVDSSSNWLMTLFMISALVVAAVGVWRFLKR
jgi:hypothetical protein